MFVIGYSARVVNEREDLSMAVSDYTYYSQRAHQEQLCVERSTSVEQRQVHEQLHALYLAQCEQLEAALPSAVMAIDTP